MAYENLSPEQRMKLNELLSMSTIKSDGTIDGQPNETLASLMRGPTQQQPLSRQDLSALQMDNSEPGVFFGSGQANQAPQMPQNYFQRGNNAPVDLGPSRSGPLAMGGPDVALDYSSPIEMAGVKGYRVKGDPFAAYMQDGTRLSMGRDTGAERTRTKENLALDAQRANIAQTNLENKAKQSALDEDASLKAGNAMTAKQYERIHGRIPSGFEIYRTETGETDIRPVQGGKQYIELQDRLNKFESSKKSVKEYEDQINTLEKHPGRESATGFSSITNPIAFSGGDAKTFLNELETFQSQAFLSNIDKLRGTGPLSNVEGEKLQAAVGNLNPTSDEATFVKNLKYVKQKFNDLKSVAEKEADQARSDLKREKPKLTSADGEAMAWAMKNPTDPRAAKIKERLGVR